MGILADRDINLRLMGYYIKNYGFRDDEHWLATDAVNIRRFTRDGRLIILKCHIIKGTVTERVMEYLG